MGDPLDVEEEEEDVFKHGVGNTGRAWCQTVKQRWATRSSESFLQYEGEEDAAEKERK